MKKYTQADFDALKRSKNGYIKIPAGDWREVDFGGANKLRFSARCILGNGAKLGDHCILGKWCKLGDGARLSNWCKLGDKCALGNACVLGRYCEPGDGCSLEGGNVPNAAFLAPVFIGPRKAAAYCYCDTKTGEISVRVEDWFGSIEDFVTHIAAMYAGTQYEIDCKVVVTYALHMFAQYKSTRG